MTTILESRRLQSLAIVAVALLAWLLRAWPLMTWGGTGPKIDYDEGAYFSTAALLWKGVWPYRDFVMVHPPGLLIFLSPIASMTSVIGPRTALALARWSMTLVGFFNALLLGRTVERTVGPTCGAIASALYAISPEAVIADRSVSLEPVLNLCALGMVNAAFRDRPRHWLAGAYAAAGVAVKVLAGVWALALLALLVTTRRWAAARSFAVAGIATGVFLIGPFVVIAPQSFFDAVVHFQAIRPPDGFDKVARLAVIWNANRLIAWLPAVLALLVGLFNRHLRTSDPFRVFGAVYGLMIGLMLIAPTYWKSYNVLATAAESALGGVAWAQLLAWLMPLRFTRRVATALVAAALIMAGTLAALYRIAKDGWHHDEDLPTFAAKMKGLPATTCLVAIEPGLGLVAGKLPPSGDGAPVIPDPYATTLMDAMADGHFSSTAAAQASVAAERRLRPRMEACQSVVLGDSFSGPLGFPDRRSWFRAEFVGTQLVKGRSGLDRWERRRVDP